MGYFLVTTIYLNFFLSSLCFGEEVTPVTTESDSDAPQDCGNYRRLARISNTFSSRGEICCENLGCFSNAKGTPWEHLGENPDCMSAIKPEFFLFTPENPSVQSFDYFTFNDTLDKLQMTINRQFFVIIHGFNTNWPINFMFPMKDELIRLGNNVLLVRWTTGSNKKNYIKAAANTRTVGKAVGIIVQALVDHKKVDLSTATIIGFSLGAHTAGYAGNHLQNLKRIIGLDPAGPLFVCEDVNARLSSKDAKFVQAIHTNGESFLAGGLGTLEPMGHVDFYANGGRTQPGCPPTITTSVLDFAKFDFSQVGSVVSCSHKRCPWLFTEMLRRVGNPNENSCSFTAFPCDDRTAWKNGQCFTCPQNGCPAPGYNMDLDTPYKGKFFFNTHTDNSTDGGFCGKQMLATLVTNKDVKGSISASFYGLDSDKSEQTIFQKSSSTIIKGEPKSSVIVAPYNATKIDKIIVLYSRYKSNLRKDGTHQFELQNVTIADISGVKFTSCSELEVETDKPAVVKFAPNC